MCHIPLEIEHPPYTQILFTTQSSFFNSLGGSSTGEIGYLTVQTIIR